MEFKTVKSWQLKRYRLSGQNRGIRWSESTLWRHLSSFYSREVFNAIVGEKVIISRFMDLRVAIWAC
jgi:hypothetical protein